MFNVGDLVTYSAHGICRIDDICAMTYSGVTRTYYVMHPIEDNQLTIQCPTDNKQAVMLEMMNQDEAEEILNSFKLPGIGWVEKVSDRKRMYNDLIKSGNRKDIAKVLNTLMRRKSKVESNGKKLGEADRRILSFVQSTLFKELAFSLNSTFEKVERKVKNLIQQN